MRTRPRENDAEASAELGSMLAENRRHGRGLLILGQTGEAEQENAGSDPPLTEYELSEILVRSDENRTPIGRFPQHHVV
jgi:hypothetical protein